MKIETKFDVGDEAWVIQSEFCTCKLCKTKFRVKGVNSVIKVNLSHIQIDCFLCTSVEITYCADELFDVFEESEVFETKEEALAKAGKRKHPELCSDCAEYVEKLKKEK